MFRIFLATFCLFVTACSTSLRTHTPQELGQIVDLHTGQTFTPQAFVSKVSHVDRLLLGERHDNRKHHQAQLWLLTQLQAQRPQGSLLLEMLNVDQQPLADRIQPTHTVNELPALLNWNKSWSWPLYGEIVEQAARESTPLIATNLNRQEVQTLLQGAEPLRGYLSTTKEIKQKLSELITSSHRCEDCQAEDPTIQRMVEVQQFRDRRMAEKVLQSKLPNMLIAGNHHVNRAYGAPLHLRDLSPETKVTVVMMAKSVEHFSTANADYIWILPE